MSEIVKNYGVAYRWPSVVVSCPAGKKMTGGGGYCKSLENKGWVFLYANHPINDNQWTVACDTPEQHHVMAEAFVVCI